MSWDNWDPDDFGGYGGGGGRKGKGKDRSDEGYELGEVEVINETDAAILVRGKGLSSDPFNLDDRNEEQWVPKSQVHERSEVMARGDVGLLVISTWLAKKRNLV